MKSSSRFLLMLEDMKFLDRGSVVLSPTLGQELVMYLREFIVEEMHKFIIDAMFTPSENN